MEITDDYGDFWIGGCDKREMKRRNAEEREHSQRQHGHEHLFRSGRVSGVYTRSTVSPITESGSSAGWLLVELVG